MSTLINYFKLYPFSRFVFLLICLVRTKLFYRPAKMIRFPFDIRGKRNINFGAGFVTGFGCRIEAYPADSSCAITIGKNVQINDYVHITAMRNVTIGNNVLIASKVYISDCTHGSYAGDSSDSSPLSIPIERIYVIKDVIIEDNVWLGEHVSVLPGVVIGSGTIVGSNSVVTKSLPANIIAVGIPAKPIKKFNFETLVWDVI